jgi:Uma2 family endonuclease
MTTAERKTKVSVNEYFAYDEGIQGKAEYFEGEIFDMAGGSRAHARIGTNFTVAVGKRLENTNCEVSGPDLRIELIPGRSYAYPDSTILCGVDEYSHENPNTIRNPTVVMEVLSPSTEAFDRGMKRDYYMSIPSVQVYLLIEQSEPKVDIFTRETDERWSFIQVTGLDATLHINALEIPIAIPLTELYRRVSFPD